MITEITYPVETVATYKHAVISLIREKNLVLLTITSGYVPMNEFKELFVQLTEVVKQEKITKFIFDKRQMTTFHQPSMEWYHLEWKENMYKHGLCSHRKLLPQDKFFEQSVEMGRKKIARDYPDFNFSKYDIVYCTSLEEAIEK